MARGRHSVRCQIDDGRSDAGNSERRKTDGLSINRRGKYAHKIFDEKPEKSVRLFINERISVRCDLFFNQVSFSSDAWQYFCQELIHALIKSKSKSPKDNGDEQSSRQ